MPVRRSVLSSGPMLDLMRRGLRRALLPLGFATAAAFGLSTSGCIAVLGGMHETTLTFPLEKKANIDAFWAWNEITVDQDITSVDSARLVSVNLKISAPPGQDFSFLRTLQGEAVTSSGRTLVAKLDNVPPGEPAISMAIMHTGDLHPLFRDAHTIRLEWTGATNPAFTAWPAEGFTVEVTVTIDIQ